jgi:hypothetical protein
MKSLIIELITKFSGRKHSRLKARILHFESSSFPSKESPAQIELVYPDDAVEQVAKSDI